jgi:DNA replication and repair protein RecF
MRLDSLTIRQVRNLSEVNINPNPEINIIYGENASGKTAILESIYLLSKARSFRTAHIKEVIQHKQEDLTVSGLIHTQNNKIVSTGLRKSSKETEIRYNGERVKAVSEQAKNVVVQTANPDNTKLLTGTPKDRRKWIDWALFHVEHDYLEIWHSYHRALRNRNALLRRAAKEEEYYVWENIMANTAKDLKGRWQNYLDCLQQYYQETADQHACVGVTFAARKDKYKTEGFLEHLQSTRSSDIKAGFTQQGPHKADLEFKIEGKHINTVFSRGQIKLFVVLLSIAQAKLLKNERQTTPIFLVDDLTAELDKKTVDLLLELLYKEKMQLFITSTDPDKIIKKNQETTLFHVEQGRVKNVRIGSKNKT